MFGWIVVVISTEGPLWRYGMSWVARFRHVRRPLRRHSHEREGTDNEVPSHARLSHGLAAAWKDAHGNKPKRCVLVSVASGNLSLTLSLPLDTEAAGVRPARESL